MRLFTTAEVVQIRQEIHGYAESYHKPKTGFESDQIETALEVEMK